MRTRRGFSCIGLASSGTAHAQPAQTAPFCPQPFLANIRAPRALGDVLFSMSIEFEHHDVRLPGPPGDQRHGELKCTCFVYVDGRVYWVLEDFLGAFHRHRRSVNLTNESQKERKVLREVAEAMGLDFGGVSQASLRQCQSVSVFEPGPYTRSQQTVSTKGVLLLLAWWATSSWRQTQKDIGGGLLRSFVRRLAVCDWCDQAWARGAAGVATEMCSPEVAPHGCNHVRCPEILAEANQCADNRARVACLLERYLLAALQCESARHMSLGLLAQAASEVDRFLGSDDHEATKPHKIDINVTKGGKRRRATDVYRRFVINKLMERRRGKHGKVAMALDGYDPSRYHRWMKKSVCSYFLATTRALGKTGTFGMWEDGARLGKPGREFVLSVVYSCASSRGAVLPPQVLSTDTVSGSGGHT